MWCPYCLVPDCLVVLRSVSGHVPSEPVVSRKSGHLFEKRLIEKEIQVSRKDFQQPSFLPAWKFCDWVIESIGWLLLKEHGICPVTKEPLALDDLMALKLNTVSRKHLYAVARIWLIDFVDRVTDPRTKGNPWLLHLTCERSSTHFLSTLPSIENYPRVWIIYSKYSLCMTVCEAEAFECHKHTWNAWSLSQCEYFPLFWLLLMSIILRSPKPGLHICTGKGVSQELHMDALCMIRP